MKKSNNAKTRKIAAALAALSIASAMALPASSVAASAAESSEIVCEFPEIDTNPAVIQETDELLGTVTTTAEEPEQIQETTTTETTTAQETTSTAQEVQTAETTPVKFVTKPEKDIAVIPLAKKLALKGADAAFDTVGKAVPGTGILLAPVKALFHAGLDEPDPLQMINSRLEDMDSKLDEMSEKLCSLDSGINRNTQWMGSKIENCADLSDLRNDFRNLSPEASKLVRDISSIENNSNLNKNQKILRLAALTNTERFDRVTTYIYKIMKAMGGKDIAYTDMFETLYKKEALRSMFAKEAYNRAYPVAEALTQQYIYAISLVEECQLAAMALEQFGEDEIADISGNAGDLAKFRNFNFKRHNLDMDDMTEALNAVADGFQRFKDSHDNCNYIRKGTENRKISFSRKLNSEGGKYLDPIDESGKNALSVEEVTELADYVRANYPGKSVYEYLRDNGVSLNIINPYYECYLVVGKTLDDHSAENKECSGGVGTFGASRVYDHSVTFKAISITDPEVKVVDVEDYNYAETKVYVVFIKAKHYEKYDEVHNSYCIVNIDNQE